MRNDEVLERAKKLMYDYEEKRQIIGYTLRNLSSVSTVMEKAVVQVVWRKVYMR